MDPVRLATSRVTQDPDAGRSRGADALADDAGGVASLQFGDEVVYIATEAQWPGLTDAATRGGRALREQPGEVDRARLHLVVQKGRLFQRELPDAPVLVDKGRFLLVDLDPEVARRLAARREPCFTVRPLEALGEERVVFAALGAARALRREPDPGVQAVVDRISRASFEADLAALVALPTRLSTTDHYRQACGLLEGRLASLGYATSRQTISVGGSQSENVVARRQGTAPGPRGTVLVTAHLDSVNHEDGDASPAPGADDDGSGSAGVVEIARALGDYIGGHDVVFALFGGEEQGLLGSEHFVAALSEAERGQVRAVVNMDMIGTLNTPAPTVLLEGRALSQGVIDELAAAAATYTGLAVETSVNAANSDHVSFLDAGIPAVLTIEGADSTNDEVHTARDTIDRINFDLALEILRMNAAFVATALDA